MFKTLNKPFSATQWVSLFIAVHLVCWTLLPALIRYNLPLDAIEGTIWGHQLEWGYDKNPYMNAWLTALASQLGGASGWTIYLFSQLSVIVCFWAVYRLGSDILGPIYALIGTLMLEGVQYFNFHSIDFNDNTLELGLWGATIYCFYRAMKCQPHTASATFLWIFVGIFAGLGMMAKYYTITLIASLCLFMLSSKDNRKQFATLSPYAGLLAFLIVTLPHVVWLFAHDFITVKYVFARASSMPHWTNHFFFPAQFAWQQMEVFLPALILFSVFFYRGKKGSTAIQLSPFDRHFLLIVGFGPIALTLLLSLICGTNLRAGWGAPLLSLWGLALIALLHPRITPFKLYGFIVSVFALMAALLLGYFFSLTHSHTTTSANFPGQKLADTITQIWHDTYHRKLDYIAGSRWAGGNIAFYSPDHPAVFIEWSHEKAPWIDLNALKEKGGVFVWDITGKETLPAAVKQAFPQLQTATVMEFDWHRNQHRLEPAKIGMAILPPDASTNK